MICGRLRIALAENLFSVPRFSIPYESGHISGFLICLPCLVLIARQLHRAPEGFEDEKGFHYGIPEPAFHIQTA